MTNEHHTTIIPLGPEDLRLELGEAISLLEAIDDPTTRGWLGRLRARFDVTPIQRGPDRLRALAARLRATAGVAVGPVSALATQVAEQIEEIVAETRS
jgi:hypothetical protein